MPSNKRELEMFRVAHIWKLLKYKHQATEISFPYVD